MTHLNKRKVEVLIKGEKVSSLLPVGVEVNTRVRQDQERKDPQKPISVIEAENEFKKNE